jgi:hypothetical protein
LRREAERANELFQDPQRAGVLLVTIPEDMPSTETIELYGAVHGELKLPVCGLVINQTLRTLFEAAELPLLRELAERVEAGSVLQPLAAASRARAEREQLQSACIERLEQAIPARQVRLPLSLQPDFRRREVEELGGLLVDGFAERRPPTAAS